MQRQPDGVQARSCKYNLFVELPAAYNAEVIMRALDVDRELRPELVTRSISVDGRLLCVYLPFVSLHGAEISRL